MSPIAIVMLIISIVIIWGGLVAAVINLRVRPEVKGLVEPAEFEAEDDIREHDGHLYRDT